MIVSERIVAGKYSKNLTEYLIRCDACGKEEWLVGNKCRFGQRKYCSVRCINLGRKKTEEQKRHLSEVEAGSSNHFFGKHHSDESRKKMSKAQSEMGGLYNMMKNKLTDDEFKIYWVKYCENLSGDKNHFFGKTHSTATREHLSITRANLISSGQIDLVPSHYGLKGYYTSKKTGEIFRFDSFIEYLRMIILDADSNIANWTKRHKIRIKYEFDGAQKNYIPDFLIVRVDGYEVIEEVKGYENKKKKEAKFLALRRHCNDNGFGCSIVTYEDVKDMCPIYFGKSIDTLRERYKKGLFNG